MKIIVIILAMMFIMEVDGQNSIALDNQIEKTTFIYKQIEDIKIRADFYCIRKDKSLKPAIIWIHGGALIFGSRNDLPEEQMKLYINAGYSVISIDYRLAPETKLQDIVLDVKDAIIWAQENGEKLLGIDTNKISIIGHSAGAYLALMTGYILENPPKCIVSFYGYGDILAEWYNKPDSIYNTWDLVAREDAFNLVSDSIITSASIDNRFNFYLYCRQNGIWTKTVSDYDPFKSPDKLTYYCPIKNINTEYPPTMLIHGDEDTDVPFLQSVLFSQELADKKVDYRFIKMAGYGHVFDTYGGDLGNGDILNAFYEVIDFLDKQK